MNMIDELKALGVNTEEALQRFMGKTALYEKMLGKLPAAVTGAPVMSAFDAEDHKTALENAHTLKGVMGNLSLTPLYDGYTKIVDMLRADDPAGARKILEDLMPVQEKIIDCIEKCKE